MLKTYFCISALLLALLPVSVASAQIQNPDFENGTDGWIPKGIGVQRTITTPGYESAQALKVTERSLYYHGVSQSILGAELSPDTDYHVQVWVKTLTVPEGALRLEIHQADDRGDNFITIGEVLAVNDQWTLLEGGFRYQENGDVTKLQLNISGINEDPSLHDFIIDAVSITENDWRGDAEARIEQIRKRDVRLSFVDADGSPRSDLQIDIQQIGHQFGFGSTLNEAVATNPAYATFFEEHFEWATIEWRSQWKPVEAVRGVEDYTNADFAAVFAKQNGINLRGHALAWANEGFVPSWLPELTAPETLTELDERITNVTTRFDDSLRHWDVNNEMLDYSFFADRLGETIRPWMFQQARENDADVKLFTNEFGIHQSAFKAKRYRDMILELEAGGAEVGGIGLQSHFFQGNTSAKGLEIALNNLADLGKPIWATEFDVVNPDPNERAKCLVDFYTYVFSRPEFDGVVMWGFWAGTHWLGADASLLDDDWTVNAAGQSYLDLMNQWKTVETASIINDVNQVDFRGFYGRYLVTVTDPVTGVSNWHLINVTSDGTDDVQEFSIVPGSTQDSLTVYGTEGDDRFGLDFGSPGVLTFNDTPQYVDIWDEVSRLNFEGFAGNDVLIVNNDSSVETRYNIRPDRATNRDSGFEFGYSNIEDVMFFSGSPDDFARFFDSTGDDHFETRPEYSKLTIESGIRLAVFNYGLVFARASGGNDTVEMYDSEANDVAYSNLDSVRIRDPHSVRRADSFDSNFLFSMNANDRIVYQVPSQVNSMTLGDGVDLFTVEGREFECRGFGNSRLIVDPANQAALNLTDSSGDDVLSVNEDRLVLFSADYRLVAIGVSEATVDSDHGGNDLAVFEDSSGDDRLTASGDTFVLDGQGYDFSITGYDRVRAFGSNGGTNSTSVSNPNFILQLFNDWGDDPPASDTMEDSP